MRTQAAVIGRSASHQVDGADGCVFARFKQKETYFSKYSRETKMHENKDRPWMKNKTYLLSTSPERKNNFWHELHAPLSEISCLSKYSDTVMQTENATRQQHTVSEVVSTNRTFPGISGHSHTRNQKTPLLPTPSTKGSKSSRAQFRAGFETSLRLRWKRLDWVDARFY